MRFHPPLKLPDELRMPSKHLPFQPDVVFVLAGKRDLHSRADGRPMQMHMQGKALRFPGARLVSVDKRSRPDRRSVAVDDLQR